MAGIHVRIEESACLFLRLIRLFLRLIRAAFRICGAWTGEGQVFHCETPEVLSSGPIPTAGAADQPVIDQADVAWPRSR